MLLTDAQGLTDAISDTGRVYEEIGNMQGEQVSSVLVCRVYCIIMVYNLLLTCSWLHCGFVFVIAKAWYDPDDGWNKGISWNDAWTTRLCTNQ